MTDVAGQLEVMIRNALTNKKKGGFIEGCLRLYHSMRQSQREAIAAGVPEGGHTHSYGHGWRVAMSLAIQLYCQHHLKVYGVTKGDLEEAFSRVEGQQEMPI
jgi:hypothetical protein